MNKKILSKVSLVLLILTAFGCSSPPQVGDSFFSTSTATQILSTATPFAAPSQLTSTPAPSQVRFAVIGDYGDGSSAEQAVSELVKSWDPEFIITVGDNNYPVGAKATIDQNIGQFYADFIYPYQGKYEPGAETNLFFPSLGNHDILTENGKPYFEYFTLPGNERYYTFTHGNIQFFVVNSNGSEADGFHSTSIQAQWLKNGLENSESTWQIVYFHHPPYSSGMHGSSVYMRWPFKEWGADLVLSGHDHTYERLVVDGLTYIVDGIGGHSIYNFDKILPQSIKRYNGNYGALLVESSPNILFAQFVNVDDELIDQFEITPIQ